MEGSNRLSLCQPVPKVFKVGSRSSSLWDSAPLASPWHLDFWLCARTMELLPGVMTFSELKSRLREGGVPEKELFIVGSVAALIRLAQKHSIDLPNLPSAGLPTATALPRPPPPSPAGPITARLNQRKVALRREEYLNSLPSWVKPVEEEAPPPAAAPPNPAAEAVIARWRARAQEHGFGQVGRAQPHQRWRTVAFLVLGDTVIRMAASVVKKWKEAANIYVDDPDEVKDPEVPKALLSSKRREEQGFRRQSRQGRWGGEAIPGLEEAADAHPPATTTSFLEAQGAAPTADGVPAGGASSGSKGDALIGAHEFCQAFTRCFAPQSKGVSPPKAAASVEAVIVR